MKLSGMTHEPQRSWLSWNHWRAVWRRTTGLGTFPHELAFILTLPGRGLILSPRQLVARLHLQPRARVLEIGPGPGYFSVAVATLLPEGTLQLLDIQREMLLKARRRLRRAGLDNVHFTQGSATNLPFKPCTFDTVFLVAVLGEVSDPPACMAAVAAVLRPDGMLSVTELPGDPDALPEPAVREMAEAAGLRCVERFPVRGGFTINVCKGVDARDVAEEPR